MFKVNNKDIRAMPGIVLIVNFEHISHLALVFSTVNFEHAIAALVISNKTIGEGPHHHKLQANLEKSLNLLRKF